MVYKRRQTRPTLPQSKVVDDPGMQADETRMTVSKRLAPTPIVWRNVVVMSVLHVSAAYGLYRAVCGADYRTWITTWLGYVLALLGVTAGAHRLWSHRSYKAKLPLRIFLALCYSSAYQNDLTHWVRDHRVHHKHSETDADPHNYKRGFFFAHIGWLLQRKHPDVTTKGRLLDCSDMERDVVCSLQKRFYFTSVIMTGLVLPTFVPWYFWGESVITAYFFCGIFRMVWALHSTWLVNSLAHVVGNRPYDSGINPAENLLVTLGVLGEGFHNYHHTFPSDYAASAWGWSINFTTCFIDVMALLGLAYDRKTTSRDSIKRRQQRTGDDSNSFSLLPATFRWGSTTT